MGTVEWSVMHHSNGPAARGLLRPAGARRRRKFRPGGGVAVVMTSPHQAPRPLHAGFLRSAAELPDRPALEVDGRTLTFAQLRDRAASVAATLQRETGVDGPPLTAVFAYRSETAFAGVLGALMRGHGYVPLHPGFPVERTRAMLERSGCRALVVDSAAAELLDGLLAGIDRPLVLVLPGHDDVAELAARFPEHVVVGAGELAAASDWEPVETDTDAIAYLLFTSGSTGIPKGVMVAHRNVSAFIDVMVDRYAPTPEDRFSQTFDMTFDLSVFDMFVAWERGSCLCCPPEKALMTPSRFIRDSAITIWFSVPSTAVFMKKLGLLKPDAYPGLRLSLFCGEPLPAETARSWAAAAPNSIVENLYGPTELTIACTLYRWDPGRSPEESALGVVPIGAPYPGMTTLIVDDELREVAPGQDGELLLTGPQVTLGYLDDPEKTAAAFVVPPGRDRVFYRTGDRVRRPDGEAPLTYRGRVDHQIKVLGHRVELGEIEAAIRDETGADGVVAVGWPPTPSGAGGVVAFVGELGHDVPATMERLRRRLPDYMVPRELHLLAELPLNANGKFDRKALVRSLEETREPNHR
jgi:amino acid adenylation domain-containing protein